MNMPLQTAPTAKNLHSNICILMQCECKCVCLYVCLCLCLSVSTCACCLCKLLTLFVTPIVVVVALLCRGARADSSNIYMQNKIWKKKGAEREAKTKAERKTEKSKGQANNRIKLLGQRICSVKQLNRLTIIESTVSATICNITYSNQCESVQFVYINIAQPFPQ